MQSRLSATSWRRAFGLAWCLGVAAAAGAEARFVAPDTGTALTAGALVDVRWVPLCDASVDEVELVLSADGGLTFPVRLTASLPPCASEFRWRVPSLPATRARLAVRRGLKGHPETERLAFVSGEFAILSTGTEGLIRGPAEWWTLQALTELCAEDVLLEECVTGEAPRITRAIESPDLDDPDAFSALSLAPLRSGLSSSDRSRLTRPAAPPAIRCAAPIPLRL